MMLALIVTAVARLFGAPARGTLLAALGGAALAVPLALLRMPAAADALLVLALGVVAGTLVTSFPLPVAPARALAQRAWRPLARRRADPVLLAYVGLALLAMWPFLRGPYPFALDMIFGPHADALERLAGRGTFEGPGILLLAVYDVLGPTGLAGRLAALVLVAGLAAMGYGMHRLVPAGPWGRAFAGTLYVVNPFVYVRLLAGQWLFVLSLAALPLALALTMRLAREGPRWRTVAALAPTLLLAFAQPHVGVFAAATCGLVALALARAPRRAAASVGALALAALAGNLFWVLPLLLGGSPAIEGLGAEDVEAFAPRPHTDGGLGLDLLSLSGFWREAFTLPSDAFPLWPLVTAALVFLAVLGVVSARRDRVALALAAAGVLGYALSFGPRAPWGGAFVWLTEAVPPLRAFRDAQKFLVLLLVAYCYLGGLGVQRLLRVAPAWSGRRAAALGAAVLLVPVAGAFPLLSGHAGQTTAVDYPDEWYDARDALRLAENRSATLVLPWHLYLDLSFLPPAQPRVANPAASFFDGPVLQGDNPEYGGARTTDPVSRAIESALFDGAGVGTDGPDRRDLARVASAFGVTHVVLLKESDWPAYRAFLDAQPDLRVLHENARVVVYESLVPAGRVFASRSSIPADEAADVTARRPLNAVYAAEDAPLRLRGDGGPWPAEAGVRRIDPAPADDAHVMLALTQGEAATWAWEGDGRARPMLGFIPAGTGDGHFENVRLARVLLPSYAAALLALGLIAAMAWREARRA